MKKGFTIVELLVAVGLMAAMLAGSGIVFHAAVEAKRTAEATAELAQKLRGITDQLDADFAELRRDGEIFVAWVARPMDEDGEPLFPPVNSADIDGYERLDRIMFFTMGNFQSYHEQETTTPGMRKIVYGMNSYARVCYMLAKDGDGNTAQAQPWNERTLSRTQHILTADADFGDYPDLTSPLVEADFRDHNYNREYDRSYLDLQGWKDINQADKADILSIVSGIEVLASGINDGGTTVDPEDPNSIHMIMCEGVGEFSVQGWSDAENRWVPEVYPTTVGDLTDSDFIVDNPVTPTKLDVTSVPGIWYPDVEHVLGPDPAVDQYDTANLNEANFDIIPGFGRALKFTFTLYDSRGIFEEGKEFTHIIYLN